MRWPLAHSCPFVAWLGLPRWLLWGWVALYRRLTGCTLGLLFDAASKYKRLLSSRQDALCTVKQVNCLFSVTRHSWSDSVSEWVSQSHCWTELTNVTLVSEDTYWRLYWENLIINDTYGGDVREIVVLIMEVEKVVDEVTDMEIDK